jgi:hypothetical protein
LVDTSKPYRIAVVLDPDYGDRLIALSEQMPVWIVDTPTNRTAVEVLWTKSNEKHSAELGVTAFKVPTASLPEDDFLEILKDVDLHYGEYSHDPPYTVLEVMGVQISNRVREALRQLGFYKFEAIPDGFIACREI